ncbi:hypothetical protein K6Q96_18930 [Grimontia kaedaensis]|uniref:Uncharacterized protein n=2 Tax=Grimontia TaxID=246861 RepID=A0A128F433_9GAMM|nr:MULTISPECIES: hypothetical protein [Grimontia]USH05287.1 hypothetical protein K6Q96_18930 [Grimontia kaedaensis]CZF81529.1 hypothetical protein GCE9029_02669 [Grimontia celer]
MDLDKLSQHLRENGFNAVLKDGKVRVKWGWSTLPVNIENDPATGILAINYNQLAQLCLIGLFSFMTFASFSWGSFLSSGAYFAIAMVSLANLLLTESNAKELRQHIRQMVIPTE